MSELAHRQALYTIEQLELRKKRKAEGKKQADRFRKEVIVRDAAKAKRR